ncbi:hypothetical protein GBA52_028326 [Prunus armeniaca]|nr:hypothetical protein GBA52_028326 [Prunus armeniaca]
MKRPTNIRRHQLPDDITPDFKVMGEVESQGLGNLSLAGLSLHDDGEATQFPASTGSGYLLNESHINGNNFSEKLRASAPPFGDDLSSASFLHMSPKPWDKQIVNSNQLISNGQEGLHMMDFLDRVPGFSAQSLAKFTFANGCDLNLTIEMLTQLELQVDGGFNENLNSKTVSAPDLSSMDFPALTPTDGQHSHPKYGDDDLQQSGNPYRSSDKDNMLFFQEIGSEDSGGWKFERNGSPKPLLAQADVPIFCLALTILGMEEASTVTGRRIVVQLGLLLFGLKLEMLLMTANMYSDVRDEAS